MSSPILIPNPTPALRVIVVGAGWYGLAAAKTYLQMNPSIFLTILDTDNGVGGVWSRSRVYPGLIADSPVEIFDYSDMPMAQELGLEPWADIPAAYVSEYLERYAKKWGILERCRFNTKLVRARKSQGGGWELEVEENVPDLGKKVKTILLCDKLVVATGLNSEPAMPDVDFGDFEGEVFHSKDVGKKYDFLTSNNVKRVTVVGGNKSAVDVVNLCALTGKTVDWLIREDGNGAGMLFEANANGLHAGFINNARWLAQFTPSILRSSGYMYWFLHSGKSRMGIWLTEWFWRTISKVALKDTYQKSENGKKIAPTTPNLLWSTAGVSVLHNNSTFMDMVNEGSLIHVHRASIISISSHSISLSNGLSVCSDVLVFATGWDRSQLSIFDSSEFPELGLPVKLDQQPVKYAKYWNDLDDEADKRICDTFPMLRNARLTTEPPPDVTPFRLYRQIAPSSPAARGDRSLVFLGLLGNTRVPTYAEISALWSIAYLENLFADTTDVVVSHKQEMDKSISEVNAWMRRRYGYKAVKEPDAAVEVQDFIDAMMRDLGLRTDRKRAMGRPGILGLNGWAREWFLPYKGQDYTGIVEEFLEKREKMRMKDITL